MAPCPRGPSHSIQEGAQAAGAGAGAGAPPVFTCGLEGAWAALSPAPSFSLGGGGVGRCDFQITDP